MRECSSCQTVNDDSAQFCLECGQKLVPAGRAQADPQNAGPSGRPRLHSPILGGYEEIDDTPRQEKPRNTAPKAKGAHLRSPLLGGGDDDEEQFDDSPSMKPVKNKSQQARPGGGKMRSPLLGGGGGGGATGNDDYEEDFPLRDRNDDRSAFPHRSRPREAVPEMPAQNQPTGGKAHLRSPLLGGSDDDDDYEDPPTQSMPRKSAQTGRPVKLHSPMFDRSSGSGNSGGYSDYDDEEVDEVDDPNVLRSPLLAAKSRMPASRQPNPPDQQNQSRPNPNANQARPYPAPAAVQPGGMTSTPPTNMSAGAMQNTGIPLGQSQGQAPNPPFNAPPINIQQPGFAPPPTPPSPASLNGLQPSPLAGAPANYEFGASGVPLGSSPLGSPFPQPQQAPVASQPPTLLEPQGQAGQFGQPSIQPSSFSPSAPGTMSGAISSTAPTSSQPAPAKNDFNAAGRSTLIESDDFLPHPAVEDLTPQPKKKPRGGRFASPALVNEYDDDADDLSPPARGKGLPLSAQQPVSRRSSAQSSSDDSYGASSHGSSAPAGPIMVVFVTAFLCLIAKVYFIQSFWKTFAQSMPMLLDQVGQVAILVGLIVFAMQGNRK